MAFWSGWLALAIILVAFAVPNVAHLAGGKRAAPGSRPIRVHVALGLATAALTFVHTLFATLALGAPGAVEGGMLALAPGAVALFLVVAHVGIGLQLRDVRLRDRARKRRAHWATALAIIAMVSIHAISLLRT